MKEEREKEAARLAATIPDFRFPTPTKRKTQSVETKEEKRKMAHLQELENVISALEADLANLGAQLESPLVRPNEVIKLGKEYERVQKEMDEKLAEWESMQG
jgi:predicted RNase H-like nuclease (RuvC/YqgF family)